MNFIGVIAFVRRPLIFRLLTHFFGTGKYFCRYTIPVNDGSDCWR